MEKIIEGLLFLSGDEGLTLTQLKNTCDLSELELIQYLQKLDQTLENRGIKLICFNETYKLVSNEEVLEYAKKLYTNIVSNTLSNAALETLAIIAYKQPVTKSEIEDIRGVNCDNMIRKLELKGLIEQKGRSELAGRAFYYGVTDVFLDSFQLTSVNELPPIPNQEEVEELF